MDREELLSKSVVVICGGWSDEREISLLSGEQCALALQEAGFARVDTLDPADDGFVSSLSSGGYDVAFVAMHGRYGEDGCIQGLLEVMRIPYTFSGVSASAAATEKEITKAIYAAAGIRAPRGIDVSAGCSLSDEQIDRVIGELGLPLFVKPAANGSSYGITRVTERSALNGAIALAGRGGGRVLIEECVEGTEITVPVIGNDEPRALPIVEIVTGSEFYDLKVKYEPSAMHHVIPARLEPGIYARAQEIAVRAHRALGCSGCSRSDFIVNAEGEPIILETNTIPGMTSESLLPDSARHGGIEFPELCRRFVEYALDRASR
ncbi:D-alanine--D-alanine ligase family protein [Thermophilibacter mediterraneus]|uniref:D-alanine--D-alanine ligase family protein n=1 Tax=Thermophilibacter mediterraneus TaxID=1871031 RepID=UPI000931608B|nr:D-alanine--D-alanine ligase [Thermophilibacter mediterraneus]